MASAAWALQKSVYAAVAGDSNVMALLSGARLYDDVPPEASYPYVTFGQSSVRDWSAGGEDGHEHIFTLHVWSQAAGRRQAHEIMGALKAALHDRPLALEGFSLVNLRHEFSEARRDPDGETYHGIVRYRAVTEPAA